MLLILACFVAVVLGAGCPPLTFGGKNYDLNKLHNTAGDYELHEGSPCNVAAQCPTGTLPWSLYFQICGPTQAYTTNCDNSVCCQQWTDGSASLGSYANVKYAELPGGAEGVLLTSSGGTENRQISLQIQCTTGESEAAPTFTAEVASSFTYEFTWKRKEACATGGGPPAPSPPSAPTPPGAPTPPPAPGTGGGLSGGSIFLILLLVGTVVYCGAGMAFMAGVKGQRGKDMVPNLAFWSALPGYVKDGVLFCVNKVRGGEQSFAQV